jgi:hypothetical protein
MIGDELLKIDGKDVSSANYQDMLEVITQEPGPTHAVCLRSMTRATWCCHRGILGRADS